MLTEAQVAALEKAKSEKESHGEFESECPGYCGAQDTFYVGNMKGVGRIYQQTFIDTYSKVAFAKLYDRKTPITAAEILNDRVLPFFEEHGIALTRVLTDRGTEYCGNPEHHEYELYLAIEDVDHTRTKTKSPQTNGICERFHKTVLNEFYRVAFRKTLVPVDRRVVRSVHRHVATKTKRLRMVPHHKPGLPAHGAVVRAFELLRDVLDHLVPLWPPLLRPLLEAKLSEPLKFIVLHDPPLHGDKKLMVDVVFQPDTQDELGEVEDELECLGDDDLVLGFIMVVAMMLNPITAALYLLDYRPLIAGKLYPGVL